MELSKINLEFDDQEINSLVKKLNELFKHQQVDFSNLCYTVYKIDCWFVDNEDQVLKSKTNDYYDRKQLFKALGFTNKQVNRYCKCYQEFMERDDVGSKLKEPFVCFSSSKLIELLPLGWNAVKYIDSGKLNADMTVKEIRAFLRSLEDTSSEDLEDEENQISEEELNFLVLKNDTARKDFLDNYKTWGLWFEEPRLKTKYYRCKIGERILIAIYGMCDYGTYTYGDRYKEGYNFYWLTEKEELILDPTCVSQIIKEMSAVSDKKVYLFD